MRLLLDTHTFLWFVLGDPQLSPTARTLIADPAHDKFISAACPWEVAIKISTGKYSLAIPFETFFATALSANSLQILPIELKHAAAVATLPMHHRDPFDRLIIAQAIAEKMSVVSCDGSFDAYGVTRIW